MFRRSFYLLLVLGLALSACTVPFRLPLTRQTGPLTVEQIALPVPPDAAVIDLSLSFGAGKLILNPGTDSLVSGSASYNVEDFKPIISVVGGKVSIEQGDWHIDGIPDFNEIKNEWNLMLGNVPMNLSIDAGAYQAEYEFGGLALTNLTISDGAADVTLNFSESNTTEMTLFKYQTGASNVSLLGLGNANFSTLEFDSGAGNYTLDFSGELKRDASVNIETGVSNMTLVIPDGIPVQITIEGGLSNITHGTGWEKDGNVYTQEGSGPQLTIVIEIGAGNLTITR